MSPTGPPACRVASRAAALLALTLLSAAAMLTVAAGPSQGAAPSRLLVTADEWSYLLSQPKLRRGPALVELRNRGEDPHDLRLRRQGGKRTFRLDRVGPGDGGRIEVRLRRASRYRLWCSLPGHRGRGMEAKLRVARKR